MPKGGTLRVSLEHDLQGNVVLTFKDEGKGIDSERLDSIFDPFQNFHHGRKWSWNGDRLPNRAGSSWQNKHRFKTRFRYYDYCSFTR